MFRNQSQVNTMQSIRFICPSNPIHLFKRFIRRNIHRAWPGLENEIKSGLRSLDILLVVSSHNTMSQKALSLLSSLEHKVMIEIYDKNKLLEQVQALKPHLIICPFLTRPVPAEIYHNYITLIVHPGPIGDRGRHSVDRWILERPTEWGVTVLEADQEMDAGPVWAEEKLDTALCLPSTATKSDAYNLLTTLAMKALRKINTQILQGKYPGVIQSGKCYR
jgi:putative two-component system protein, hydrogenase maturation factor HypX/HoxX